MVISLRDAIDTFPDKRTGNNNKYSMIDIGTGAFSVFFAQSPSFLDHQRLLEKRYGIDSTRTLFGMKDIPTDTHIRSMLDSVTPDILDPVFHDCFKALNKSGHLEEFRTDIGNNDLLIALDGTWYFSSTKIHCNNCSIRKRTGVTTHMHGMINPALVTPGRRCAIALPPEFILPQDGDRKQDCESKAGKRWLNRHTDQYVSRSVTLLGDDLYCKQPMCESITDAGFNFILVCKPNVNRRLILCRIYTV
jgi:hypothetical protein